MTPNCKGLGAERRGKSHRLVVKGGWTCHIRGGKGIDYTFGINLTAEALGMAIAFWQDAREDR